MLDGSTYPPHYPIYTFVDKAGVNTHIDSPRLRLWCLANERNPELEQGLAPVDRELANSFLRDNVVSMSRVIELLGKEELDPIILCQDGTFSSSNGGPNVMLVDGHHRLVLAAKLKLPQIPAFMVKLEQWKPFQVTNILDLTEEQLLAAPIQKRNY